MTTAFPKLDRIRAVCAETFGVPIDELLRTKRQFTLHAQARWWMMWVLRLWQRRSLKAIGQLICPVGLALSHTSVNYGLGMCRKLLRSPVGRLLEDHIRTQLGLGAPPEAHALGSYLASGSPRPAAVDAFHRGETSLYAVSVAMGTSLECAAFDVIPPGAGGDRWGTVNGLLTSELTRLGDPDAFVLLNPDWSVELAHG